MIPVTRAVGTGRFAAASVRLLERDLELCRRAARVQRSSAALAFFRFVSRAGDGACWFALAAAIVVLRGVDGLPLVATLSATAVLATLASRAIKGWINRPRPFRVDPTITAGCAPLDAWSFPSGHTLHAVAFQCVLIADAPRLALLLAPWTIAIGLSRVVLGLHFPSDVAAGAALGALVAATVLAVS